MSQQDLFGISQYVIHYRVHPFVHTLPVSAIPLLSILMNTCHKIIGKPIAGFLFQSVKKYFMSLVNSVSIHTLPVFTKQL